MNNKVFDSVSQLEFGKCVKAKYIRNSTNRCRRNGENISHKYH